MALQFVGSTSGSGTSNGYTVSLSGTLTGGIASSPSAGDFVVVVSAFGNTASSAPAVSGNNSGAYTGFKAATHVNDTWDTEFRTFYAVMGSTPDTSLTVTRATNTSYGGATVVMVYRGQDTSAPFSFNSTVATITNGSRAVTPNATVSATDEWVVSFGAGTQGTAGSAFTVPSQLTGNSLSVHANGTTSDIGVWAADVAPGITGTYTISAPTGGTTSASSSGAAHTIVLTPQPAAVTHDTSGALAGPGSSVVGSATRFRAHAATGALDAGSASVVGSASRSSGAVTHATTGVLGGVTSSVSGGAARTRQHPSSGALTGPGATLTGSAAHVAQHATSGALSGPGTALAGSAARTRAHGSSGTLSGPGTSVAGSAARFRALATSGALTGPGSTLSGSASRSGAAVNHATAGALVGPGAELRGAASGGIQLLGGGPGGPSKYREKGSAWERLLSPPMRERVEALEPEVAEVLVEAVVAQAPRADEARDDAREEMQRALAQAGLAWRDAYVEIYTELLAERRQQQDEEDAAIALVVAALV